MRYKDCVTQDQSPLCDAAARGIREAIPPVAARLHAAGFPCWEEKLLTGHWNHAWVVEVSELIPERFSHYTDLGLALRAIQPDVGDRLPALRAVVTLGRMRDVDAWIGAILERDARP